MMTRPASAPTPPELLRAPECAALSILDHTAFAAAFALLAVNPAAADGEFDRQLDRREILADVILKHISALQSALRRYRDVAVGTERYVRDEPF
jgi:hypothetical protein